MHTEDKKRNKEDRMWFLRLWAEYVRTHSDKEWSAQQNVLIDGAFATKCPLTPKEYLAIKGEKCMRG